MEFQADPVSAEFPDNRVPVTFCMFLNNSAYVSEKTPRLCGLDAFFQTFFRDTHQFLAIFRNFPDHEHTGGIGIIAVEDGGHIHVDDIALL